MDWGHAVSGRGEGDSRLEKRLGIAYGSMHRTKLSQVFVLYEGTSRGQLWWLLVHDVGEQGEVRGTYLIGELHHQLVHATSPQRPVLARYATFPFHQIC